MQIESEERKLDQIKSMHGQMENKRRDEARSKLKEVVITSFTRIIHLFLGGGGGDWFFTFLLGGEGLDLVLLWGRNKEPCGRDRRAHKLNALHQKTGQRRDDSPPPRVGRVRSRGCRGGEKI
jgi:hypothetical protein